MIARRTRLEVNGTTISLVEWVPAVPVGPSVLLLHGGGADSAELSWGGLGQALAEAGYHVIAPDHPGFGQSARAARPATQEHLVRYVDDLVDALDLDEYVIGGLSLGGGLALGHLLQQPGRARGAILFGTFGIMPRLSDGPFGGIGHFATFLLLRTGILASMTKAYSRNPDAMERGLRAIVRDPAARTPELVQAVVTEAAAGQGLATFAQWQHDQVRWNRLRTDYTSRLHAIRNPVLLVHGDHDDGVGLPRAEDAARLLPHADLLVVADAGHWVQRDRPDVVVPAVLRFLEGLD